MTRLFFRLFFVVLTLMTCMVPVRLGRRRGIDFARLRDRLYHNRRDPTSGVVWLADVIQNTRAEWWRFSRRIPRHGQIMRGDDGAYRGHSE